MHVVFWDQRRINPVVDLQGAKPECTIFQNNHEQQKGFSRWSDRCDHLSHCLVIVSRFGSLQIQYYSMSRNVFRVKRLRGFKVHYASVYSTARLSFGNDVQTLIRLKNLLPAQFGGSHMNSFGHLKSFHWRTLSVQREFQGPSSSFPLHSFFHQLQ